jgi:hypothetical protein
MKAKEGRGGGKKVRKLFGESIKKRPRDIFELIY